MFSSVIILLVYCTGRPNGAMVISLDNRFELFDGHLMPSRLFIVSSLLTRFVS